MDHCARITSEL